MRASWEAAPIDGFERIRAPGRVLIVASPWIRAASELGLVEAGGLERALAGTPGPPGRGRTAIVALPGTRSQLHLRPVRHGGWFGGVLRGALFGIDRPLAELRVSAALAARDGAQRPAGFS